MPILRHRTGRTAAAADLAYTQDAVNRALFALETDPLRPLGTPETWVAGSVARLDGCYVCASGDVVLLPRPTALDKGRVIVVMLAEPGGAATVAAPSDVLIGAYSSVTVTGIGGATALIMVLNDTTYLRVTI